MWKIKEYITIEPVIFIFVVGGFLTNPTKQALIYRKVCMHKFNSTVCDNLTAPEFVSEEDVVQTESSYWFLVDNFLGEIPAIFTSILYGNVSDHVSRKLALILPLIGQIISVSHYVINSLVFSIPLGYLMLGPLVSGMFGGGVVFFLALSSFISAETPLARRTVRISIAESVANFGLALSSFVGGKLLDATSFVFVFGAAWAFFVTGLLYTVFIVRNPPCPAEDRDHSTCPIEDRNRSTSTCSRALEGVKRTMSPSSLKDAVLVVVRKRPDRRRTYLLIILTAALLAGVSLSPGPYLFLKRHPLGWSQTLYGYYSGYRLLLGGVGLSVILPVLKTRLRVRETLVMVVTLVSCGLWEVAFGFCTTTWAVFVVCLLDTMSPCYTACGRSLISQLVTPGEFGQVFAVFGSMQSIRGLLATALFNTVYPLTLDYWAGLCFVVGGVSTVLPIAMVIWLHVRMKKLDVYDKLDEDQMENISADPGHNIVVPDPGSDSTKAQEV